MSIQWFRSYIAMPLLLVAMVAIPSILLSFGSGSAVHAQGSTVPTPPVVPTSPILPPVATATPYYIPPAGPVNPCNYQVRPGDTLSALAVRYGTTVNYLMQLNGISNPNQLLIGQRLVLPGCVQTSPVVVKPAAPTAVSTPPTATPTAVLGSAMAQGYMLKKVIGDHLSSVIYGYVDGGWLFRSPDDGESWVLMTTKPSTEDFVMSPADPNVLVSGAGQDCAVEDAESAPMYKSVNGGMTFVELMSGRNLRPLLAHGSDKNIVYAADCSSPYLTTDGGFTWVEKMGENESPWETNLAVVMAASEFTGEPMPELANWDQLYAVGTATDGSSMVAYSTDSGNEWLDITPKSDASMQLAKAMAADPKTPGKLWVVDGQGVWWSAGVDEGWNIVFAGLQDVIVETEMGPMLGLNDIVAHPDGNLYLATVRGLYVLPAGEAMWEKVLSGIFDEIEIGNLLLTDSNPDTLWLNTPQGVFTYDIGE